MWGTGFLYLLRPAAAVSRCLVRFMRSSLIPSGPGLVNGLNLNLVGMLEDIDPQSSPIDKLLAILSIPVAHTEGNC